AVSHLRTPALTRVMDVVDHLGSTWTIVGVGLATVVLLLAFRRYVHLAAYLVAVLGLSFLLSLLSDRVARIRPTGVTILGPWEGYAYPSRPVQGLALVLAGAMYTLAPVGQWRRRAAWVAAGVLGALVAARLYLGDENPSDLASAIVLGWVTVALFFGWAVPEDAFPVSYARGRRAHLDIGGRRGEAMGQALEHQLGMVLVSAEPFGLGGSAGSTPLRLRVRRTGSEEGSEVFAKLYAVNHLRSDRYYKMARSVLYGRLEDEAPFSSVRRLVEHEDHLLRVFRDLGLPSPAPLGVVEITPEREYMVLMEYLPDARELGARPLTEAEVDGGLAIVRRMWDAGLAHRDIKPSNLLLCPDGIHVIDVAFGSVRASPWRQAVDLADMMLSLALVSSPALVYARALRLFSAEDVAEAFAACRGVTVPTQLKARLREDGRDLAGEFRRLAPPRRPVAIQRWTVRRVVDAFVVLGGLALLAWLSVASRPSAGLPAAVPGCTAIQRMALVAQSVPSAAYVPCISGLAAGWSATGLRVTDGATRFDLVSDRDADHPVHVSLLPRCDTADATPIAPRAAGARSGIRLTSVSPRYAGTMTDVFAGGCLTYVFDFERGPHIPLMSEFASSVSLFPRQDLGVELRRIMGVTLGP
ncbi:MAG TPA: hypothetical protein VFH45_11700, partial [Acidimicrobiales bacterium]|nr:hypothetical protein [Acidimicrobiales bacterium]